jgi:hypothetical protein
MSRHIRTLWITRKSIDSGFHPPELVEAWDEWSIDENPSGWVDACKAALESVGSDCASHRYIDIRLEDKALNAIFEPAEIGAIAVTEVKE